MHTDTSGPDGETDVKKNISSTNIGQLREERKDNEAAQQDPKSCSNETINGCVVEEKASTAATLSAAYG